MAQDSPYNDLSSIPSHTDDRLRLFNKLVQRGFEDAEEENRQFGEYQKYVFESALTEMDIKSLRLDNRSTLNYPILKPYLLRSLKNIVDSTPTLDVMPMDEDAQDEKTQLPSTTISEILNTKLKDTLEDNHWKHVLFKVAQDCFVGGKGIFKISTDYKNKFGFDQKFILGAVEDPTTVVFDSRARSLTKSDGEFVAELCPMTREDFEAYYPNIPWSEVEAQGRWIDSNASRNRLNWYSGNNSNKIAVVCDMFYKKYESHTIYLRNDGTTTTTKLTSEEKEFGLEVVQKRSVRHVIVYHTRFCGKIEVEAPKKTNFNALPFIRCPGEIIYKKGKEFLIPYAQHAFDAQRTKNFLMNFFLNEALNHDRGKWLVAEESITDQTETNLRKPMDDYVLRYKQYGQSDVNGNETVQHNPPAYIQPAQLPTQYLEAFSMLDGTIEKILGSQFPSMNEADLSGKALYNMADFMSASNEIFMQHLMESLTAVGQLIVDTMPKIMPPQQVGIVAPNEDPTKDTAQVSKTFMYDFEFEEGHYNVRISRGVNYKLQQQKNVEMLLDFGKMYPPLLQFLFTDGFKFMLGNMDFNHKESLAQSYERYQTKIEEEKKNPEMQKMQQMAMQAKEQELKTQEVNAKAHMLKAQTDQQKLGLDAHKLHHSKAETVMDDMVDLHKIQADLGKNRLDNLVKLLHIHSTDENAKLRMHADRSKSPRNT